MPLTRRYDPTIEDPRIPGANEFQHMAHGFVERRIRIFHIALYGAGIFLASAAALLVRWLTDVDPWGAAVTTKLGFMVLLASVAVAGAVFTVVVAFMAGDHDSARVASILGASPLRSMACSTPAGCAWSATSLYAAHPAKSGPFRNPTGGWSARSCPVRRSSTPSPPNSNGKPLPMPGPAPVPGPGCFSVRSLCTFLPRCW